MQRLPLSSPDRGELRLSRHGTYEQAVSPKRTSALELSAGSRFQCFSMTSSLKKNQNQACFRRQQRRDVLQIPYESRENTRREVEIFKHILSVHR